MRMRRGQQDVRPDWKARSSEAAHRILACLIERMTPEEVVATVTILLAGTALAAREGEEAEDAFVEEVARTAKAILVKVREDDVAAEVVAYARDRSKEAN